MNKSIKIIFLIIAIFSINLSYSATYIKKDIWGEVGTSMGEGFAKGIEEGMRQQRENEMMKQRMQYEYQTQVRLLEKQARLEMEIIKYKKNLGIE